MLLRVGDLFGYCTQAIGKELRGDLPIEESLRLNQSK